MRRTVGLLVGLCTLIALTGVAVARQLPDHPLAPRQVEQAPERTERTPQRVGAIESVTGAVERWGRLVGARREMTFSYPGASYVKVHFDRFALRPGDRVRISDPSGRESYVYPDTPLEDGWAMSVTGDTAVVRLEQGSEDPFGLRSRLGGLGLSVDKVARGFPSDEVGAEDQRRAESICRGSDEKLDAVCYKASYPVAYQKSKAVARLLINGVELCTAWRVGVNNRLLTNNHCVASQQDIRRSEVWFNYECATCGGFEVLRSTKVYGDRLIATGGTLDYALFSVRDFESLAKFGYLELDPRQPAPGEELYIPQHPRGLPTMIAMDDPGERRGLCAVDDPSYYGYAANTDVSYFCDTEGGSSGSPVISRATNKVVALHHFGGCPNSGVRIDLIYAEISQLL